MSERVSSGMSYRETTLDSNSWYLSSHFKLEAQSLPGHVLFYPLGLPDRGQAAVGLFPQMAFRGTERGRCACS